MPRPTRALLPLLATSSLLPLAACGDNIKGDAAGACGGGLLPGDLVISELMANPAGADNDASQEWFEIYNASPEDLDLQGMLLLYSNEDTTNAKLHEVSRSWIIPSQGYGVAGAILDDSLAVLPYLDYGYADDLGNMRNSTGRVVVACGDDVIDEVIYTDETESLEDGVSRGFTGEAAPDALLNDDLAQWCNAFTAFDMESLGTPGERNDVCTGTGGPVACFDAALGDYRPAVAPALGDLVITEIMTDPGAVEDENGEWFEVHTAVDFDLNGLAVGKQPDLSDAEPLTTNDCIPVTAGSYILFARSDDPDLNGELPAPHALFDFNLNQDSSQLVVSYQGEILDEMPYGTTDVGTAVNLDPDFHNPDDNDETGFSCDATTPYGLGDLGTPGAANIECEISPPTGQCFDAGTLRDIASPTTVGDLVITEVLANPEAGPEESDGEWFEIRANAAFDLNGLPVGRVDNDDVANVETEGGECMPLAPGDYVVIAKERDSALNGGLPQVDGLFDFSLPNSTDRGIWAGGTLAAPLDEVRWDSSSAGAAMSLDPTITDPAGNDVPEAFCDATTPYGDGDLGSPGAENPSCGGGPIGGCLDGGAERMPVPPQPGDLVITELMPNPAAVDDASGEWFEVLVNADVDLNGLEFGDDPANPDETLPAGGDCIPVSAGDRIIFARSDDPMTNGGLPPVISTFGFGLVNGGDLLYVGHGGAVLDQITWSGSSAGASLSLDPAAENVDDNDMEANFCDATMPYGDGDLGTPGTQGSPC